MTDLNLAEFLGYGEKKVPRLNGRQRARNRYRKELDRLGKKNHTHRIKLDISMRALVLPFSRREFGILKERHRILAKRCQKSQGVNDAEVPSFSGGFRPTRK